jgi:hypothetical protein
MMEMTNSEEDNAHGDVQKAEDATKDPTFRKI